VKGVRITHIGGPTVLIEARGWRLLTDPTFDAPGRTYSFWVAASSRKLAGPAVPPADLGRIDAVLLTHDQHGDNLDAAGRALLPGAGSATRPDSGRGTSRAWRCRTCPRSRSPRRRAGTGRR
jgi:L-ascorbate metabolism protein UlaG (beta-lactamase superfamily)